MTGVTPGAVADAIVKVITSINLHLYNFFYLCIISSITVFLPKQHFTKMTKPRTTNHVTMVYLRSWKLIKLNQNLRSFFSVVQQVYLSCSPMDSAFTKARQLFLGQDVTANPATNSVLAKMQVRLGVN